MVGGVVIGVSQSNGEALLNVQERGSRTTCAVRCEAKRMDNGESVTINVGDKAWWQAGRVFWTPQANFESGPSDIALRKIGYSH